MAVTVILEGDPLAATSRLMTAARELARETERRHPGAEIHLGGIVAIEPRLQRELAERFRRAPAADAAADDRLA
ncbi:MAG: hypothetical protein U5R48_02640 [Gammaproteobacteria bacterium]|nr:hypothetical protein [Gammaproteobacteria bacterium]